MSGRELKPLFLNDEVCVVEKPPMWLSVPGRFGEDGRPVLGLRLQEQLGKQIWPVHRLDFEVSGVIAYALSAKAHRILSKAFEAHLVKKCYQAFSSGSGFEVGEKGEWRCHLHRGKKRSSEKPWGELAITLFEVTSQIGENILEWRLYPKTGRSHQLRYELYRHGNPILGDVLYSSPFDARPHLGIALRSIQLDFDENIQNQLGLPSEGFSVAPWSGAFSNEFVGKQT